MYDTFCLILAKYQTFWLYKYALRRNSFITYVYNGRKVFINTEKVPHEIKIYSIKIIITMFPLKPFMSELI
jgi:hypothetical protein